MSHFSVAVFHRDDQRIEDLLAPYDENLEIDPYSEFTRDEAVRYCRENWAEEYITGKSDDELWKDIAHDYGDNVDDSGNIYSTYNDGCKWDWYEIGGRWADMLKLKRSAKGKYNGVYRVDEARICDIDFRPDDEKYRNAIREWEIFVDGAEKKPYEERIFSPFKPEYYIEKYGTKEKYAECVSRFSTYAVITPDGEWHEAGKMLWFGISTATNEDELDWEENYYKDFIENLDQNMIVTIVDCHI